ncbi:Transcriptional regulator, HxlR family [hydrothermal vent metagenome]|uniref:Transcriptional regulator, HxlR family n=1 Tax=hydrothermal vent metagenome TaxID=652676 RepID=A0A1W1BJI4_9ZZZZ
MKIIYQEKEYACSFVLALDMFSGKWKGVILWHLSQRTMRYGELRKASGKITQKMLTQTLRELEKNKLITRKVYPVVPPKVEYTITDNAKKLIPILKSIQSWGNDLIENNECELIK